MRRLRQVYDEHAGLQDRFMTTGRVLPELALRLGLTGLAGRASGQARDLRCDQPWPPYDRLQPRRAGSDTGDVAARGAGCSQGGAALPRVPLPRRRRISMRPTASAPNCWRRASCSRTSRAAPPSGAAPDQCRNCPVLLMIDRSTKLEPARLPLE